MKVFIKLITIFFCSEKYTFKNVIYNKEITGNCINFHTGTIFWQFSSIKAYLLKCKASIYLQVFSLKCRSSDFTSKNM